MRRGSAASRWSYAPLQLLTFRPAPSAGTSGRGDRSQARFRPRSSGTSQPATSTLETLKSRPRRVTPLQLARMLRGPAVAKHAADAAVIAVPDKTSTAYHFD